MIDSVSFIHSFIHSLLRPDGCHGFEAGKDEPPAGGRDLVHDGVDGLMKGRKAFSFILDRMSEGV